MLFQAIIIVLVLLLYSYYKLTKDRNYWSDRGVTNTGFKFFWGDYGKVLGGEPFHKFFLELYQSYPNERFVGMWELLGKPYLFIRNDFELIKSIWIKDFDHFAIANSFVKEHKNMWPADRNEKIMLKNVQSATGDEWKNLR